MREYIFKVYLTEFEFLLRCESQQHLNEISFLQLRHYGVTLLFPALQDVAGEVSQRLLCNLALLLPPVRDVLTGEQHGQQPKSGDHVFAGPLPYGCVELAQLIFDLFGRILAFEDVQYCLLGKFLLPTVIDVVVDEVAPFEFGVIEAVVAQSGGALDDQPCS